MEGSFFSRQYPFPIPATYYLLGIRLSYCAYLSDSPLDESSVAG